MSTHALRTILLVVGASALASAAPPFDWQVVVNNGETVPGDARKFNSYNQPSLNMDRLVVFRGRSKGGKGGEPAHGVFTRDMAQGTPLVTVFDRKTLVPQPNNLESTFIEPPSIPRIDMRSNTIATRGNHQPTWKYLLPDGTETRVGTTGLYTNPFGPLILGASNMGGAPDLGFFAVPGHPGLKFDVFPGAPAVTLGATLVFKGNYTVPDPDNPGATLGKTGVYFRHLRNAAIPQTGGDPIGPAGGDRPVLPIADTDTRIPGTTTRFGSTAPPSAAGIFAVLAGFDNEANPTKGGIYLAPLLWANPPLVPMVRIGGQVPGEDKGVGFNKLGEGVSFDGRFIAFWGAWGTEVTSLVLQCPTDGNKDLLAYCRETYPNGFATTVPVHQGIFVHDILTGTTRAVAKSPDHFDDFVFWNFSGRVPGVGESDETGEAARWRSASFVAVSGLVDGSLTDRTFHAAFKARKGQVVDGAYVGPVDGLYLRKGPGNDREIATLVETGMDGSLIDPAAVDPLTLEHLPVTAMGIERDGFRGNALAITVSMGTEEAGWAGIYLTVAPDEM